MWTAIFSAIGTLIVGIFTVWWNNRDVNNTDIKLGGMEEKNAAHKKNAAGKAAADSTLAEKLPEGEDLINALEKDADNADRK